MPVPQRQGGAPVAPPVRRRTLLMVDDDSDLLEAIADLVEHGLPGVKVLRARSGLEALDLLQGKHVDGIMADLGMDGMDGLQFLRIAKQCHPHIPRAMLTAHADPALDHQATDEADVQGFMSKLIEPKDLLEHVRTLLTGHPRDRTAV
ncbi:MAG TPA: response regulator [Candidatus Thermoplasmatota archaeon]|nr:response regulator [Candidatus Thermoplasmatota archaeon]